jgi:beta-aspartyl-peptidase (threonine type)
MAALAVMAAAVGETDMARSGKSVMRLLVAMTAGVGLAACATTPAAAPVPASPGWSLAVHGGAGVILRENLTPEQDAAIRAAIVRALDAGEAVLAGGGSALDAVTAAVLVLEEAPQFNAGKGAVLTEAGTHELDAAIMDGSNRAAGAVAGLTRTRNPILAARAVMEKSPHVMFAGPGADAFSLAQGLEQVENSWFTTPERKAALERVLETRRQTSADKSGTVGAVAMDKAGNLAAATSTGGMTAKVAGRVGDAPLIGAATYAQNGVCAVSSTGHGEYFIRVGVARTLCQRMQFLGESGQAASQATLDEVAALGGDGGVIVLDGRGAVAFVFNSPGMYRGARSPAGETIAIYGGE